LLGKYCALSLRPTRVVVDANGISIAASTVCRSNTQLVECYTKLPVASTLLPVWTELKAAGATGVGIDAATNAYVMLTCDVIKPRLML